MWKLGFQQVLKTSQCSVICKKNIATTVVCWWWYLWCWRRSQRPVFRRLLRWRWRGQGEHQEDQLTAELDQTSQPGSMYCLQHKLTGSVNREQSKASLDQTTELGLTTMMLLYHADNANDNEEADLNSVGKYDLETSHNGHSCRRLKLDRPDQAVLLHEAKNADEDCENPFPGRHCKSWLVQCYLHIILSGNA